MLTRQKILLHLLLSAPPKRTRTHVIKWLFLAREETSIAKHVPFYDFLPYQFGPFSFSAYYDLKRLSDTGYFGADTLRIPRDRIRDVASITATLPAHVRVFVREILAEYGALNRGELLNLVYHLYPWYASRSWLHPRPLDHSAPLAVYTCGYEGRSVDAFLDLLLRKGIRRVVDVRHNAYSRKYGFTKIFLERFCGKVGLEYVHFPSLGIPSSLRSGLSDAAAYDHVFQCYETEILPSKKIALSRLGNLLVDAPTTLMCYEADPWWCHRGRLAPIIAAKTSLEVIHL